jgi:hypothetical protein
VIEYPDRWISFSRPADSWFILTHSMETRRHVEVFIKKAIAKSELCSRRKAERKKF